MSQDVIVSSSLDGNSTDIVQDRDTDQAAATEALRRRLVASGLYRADGRAPAESNVEQVASRPTNGNGYAAESEMTGLGDEIAAHQQMQGQGSIPTEWTPEELA